MKKISILLSLVFYVFTTYAQEPMFTWDELHTKPGTQAEVQLAGYTEAGYFIVNKQEPTEAQQRSIIRSAFSPVLTVEYYNNTGARTFSKDVSTGRADDFVNVVYFNNALYVVSALFNKDAGKNILTAKQIDPYGTETKPVQIGEITAEKMSQRGLFYVNTSPDGSKLIVLTQPEYVKDQNEKIKLTMFEKGFNKKWDSEQTFPFAWSKSVDNRPYINNNGTAFILKDINIKGSDETWSVFSFAGKDLKEHKIVLGEGKKMSSIVQAFSPEGDFTTAGYFKEEGGKIKISMGDKATGSFLYRVSADGQQLKTSIANSFAKRSDIMARKIVFHDNTTILLGERFTLSERSAARAPGTPQTNETMFARDYSYNGMDIYIDGFDVTGKPLYNSTIDKNNNSKNDLGYWVSYFAAVEKGKLRIVFMDNYSKYDNRKVSINTPNILVYSTVDPVTGVAEKPQPVSKPGPVGGKEGDTYLMTNAFWKISDGQYLMRAENNSSYRIGKMVF